MEHAKEPWTVDEISPTAPDLASISSADGTTPWHGYGGDMKIANRERIVACVNACAGLNLEATPDLFALLAGAIETAEDEGLTDAWWYSEARAAIEKVREP